jgi:hypothetical protein
MNLEFSLYNKLLSIVPFHRLVAYKTHKLDFQNSVRQIAIESFYTYCLTE